MQFYYLIRTSPYSGGARIWLLLGTGDRLQTRLGEGNFTP
jgi:hypothetical protein